MENKSKDKYLFLGMVPTCVILAILFAFIAITATHGTQCLDEQEITHYAEVAESIWNDKANSIKDSTLRYSIKDESITVYSYNMFEQTVTVFFTENQNSVVVNEPNINFIGCCIFFSILAAIALFGAVIFIIATINEFNNKKNCTLPFSKEQTV